MTEERNDKSRDEKKLETALDNHLRAIITDQEWSNFQNQLPPEFFIDATEGLGQLKDTKQLESALEHLNRQMHRDLGHKKKRRKIKSIEDLSSGYWAIIFILLFAAGGYLLIRMLLH